MSHLHYHYFSKCHIYIIITFLNVIFILSLLLLPSGIISLCADSHYTTIHEGRRSTWWPTVPLPWQISPLSLRNTLASIDFPTKSKQPLLLWPWVHCTKTYRRMVCSLRKNWTREKLKRQTHKTNRQTCRLLSSPWLLCSYSYPFLFSRQQPFTTSSCNRPQITLFAVTLSAWHGTKQRM